MPSAAAPADAGCYQPALLAVNGRIGRLRYFTYSSVVALAVVMIAGVIILLCSPGMAMLMLGLTYLTFIPAIFILMIRRLNDLDRSGWYSLGTIIPFVNVALALYASFARGSQGANHYGPAPVPNSRATVMAAVGVLPAAFALGIAAGMAGVTLRGMT
jgi:uncharacterized membrane protein YhaH (DUF805 family)